MKKILAVLLAASMLFAFAACGGNNEEPTTTAPVTEEEIVTDAPTEEATEAATDAPVDASEAATDAPVADSTAAADPSAVDASSAETTAAVADKEMTKAEFVAFLNAETAKAAKGKYSYNRNCEYTKPVDVGGATDTLNDLIGSLSDGKEDINSVVGGFLGIGTKKGNFPKDDIKSNYQLKATKLTEADLQNFSYKDGVYSFTLANATNPQKDNSTPIARFTNDFITHQEVVDGVEEAAGGAISVTNTNVNYKNVKVSVAVAGGKITKINYSYAFDAVLNLKLAIIKIEGTGAAVTKAEFTNIAY